MVDMNDREVKLHLARAFLAGCLKGNSSKHIAEVLETAKSSVEFELDLMTDFSSSVNMDEMPEDW